MEYMTVSIYIESFTVTCLKKKHLSPLNLYLCIYLNEETIDGLCCQFFLYFYSIDTICEKY